MRTDGSVTNWIRDAKRGDEDAAQRLWDRYFERLIELASRHLRNAPKRMADEEDVVLSTFESVLAGARSGKFPLLQNRDDLWGLLLVITARKASNQKKHQVRLRRGGGEQRGESVFEANADGAGIAQIVKGLNTVLNQNDDDVFIALETMAGKGSEIGRSFEELKAIYDGVDRKERLRVCFDTCHVNDAGYDIVNHYDEVFAEFDRVIGLEQIAVFHVNDSLNPLGAHKDRHANIGKGTIGYDTLHRLVHDETFANVPKILETPWLCEESSAKKTIPPYKEEIEWLLK